MGGFYLLDGNGHCVFFDEPFVGVNYISAGFGGMKAYLGYSYPVLKDAEKAGVATYVARMFPYFIPFIYFSNTWLSHFKTG